MRRFAVLLLILLTGCGQAVPVAAPVAATALTGTARTGTALTSTAERPTPAARPGVADEATDGKMAAGVVAAVRGASRPDTAVGLVVVDWATGNELAAVGRDRPFRSASLVKLLMALDALGSGAASRDELRVMLSRSDDGIANVLWVRSGGSAMVVAMAHRLGLTGTHPPALPNRWGDVLMTPADVVRVYEHIAGLPRADRELLMGALRSAPRIAADGFDQHFGIPSAVSGGWAVKQGWSDSPRDLSLHSTGVVAERYVVVLLTEHPRPIGLRTAADSVTEGMRVVASALR